MINQPCRLLASIAFLFALTICAIQPASANGTSFPRMRPGTGKVVFIFDPTQPAWALYSRYGYLVRTGPASGGRNYCPDVGRPCRTVVGTFTAYRESGPECVSSKYPIGKGGAPMPNCIFFHKGYAIHGSSDVPNYNASHGCIRVPPEDAKWIDTHVNPGATIIVLPYNKPS